MEQFDFIENLTYENPDQMSAQALAYVGDAVYELYIRGKLVSMGIRSAKKLHSSKVKYAKASGQRAVFENIQEKLSEAEARVASRGRNMKSSSIPKNADPVDYSYATAFEALIGYLYLKNNKERLMEILETAVGDIS
ncbi:MAG: ribonuclease III [Clostridia bacterium]|nr:ribonuclease III [Clostridia bacterium]MBN2882680.1 ribonuclease III [Clostridia bacterium]